MVGNLGKEPARSTLVKRAHQHRIQGATLSNLLPLRFLHVLLCGALSAIADIEIYDV